MLYDRILRDRPAPPEAEDRDRFILSKGHGPVALYAILAAKGFFPADWLDRFMEHGGRLGSHPDRTQVPGIEASTGSLGHGLPMAVGVALALRAKGLHGAARRSCCAATPSSTRARTGRRSCSRRSLGLGNLTLLVIDNHSSVLDDAAVAASGSARSAGTSTSWTGTTTTRSRRAFRVRHDDVPTAVVADIPEGEW